MPLRLVLLGASYRKLEAVETRTRSRFRGWRRNGSRRTRFHRPRGLDNTGRTGRPFRSGSILVISFRAALAALLQIFFLLLPVEVSLRAASQIDVGPLDVRRWNWTRRSKLIRRLGSGMRLRRGWWWLRGRYWMRCGGRRLRALRSIRGGIVLLWLGVADAGFGRSGRWRCFRRGTSRTCFTGGHVRRWRWMCRVLCTRRNARARRRVRSSGCGGMRWRGRHSGLRRPRIVAVSRHANGSGDGHRCHDHRDCTDRPRDSSLPPNLIFDGGGLSLDLSLCLGLL